MVHKTFSHINRLTFYKQAVMCIAVAFSFMSCGDLEQKALTFNTPLTPQQRETNPGLNHQLRAQIEREEAAAHKRKLAHEVIRDLAVDGTMSTGFIGSTKAFHIVKRDGTAALVSKDGEVTELDQLVKLIDEVTTGGAENERIVGLASHGSLAAWHAKDLSQQVIIRPQRSTFKKIKLFDAQIVSNGRNLITLSEGKSIDMWELRSGKVIRQSKLKTVQPRVIALNSQKNRYILGGNKGEVFLWTGKRKVTSLYSHAGPILNLLYIPKLDLLASTSKDGRLQIYSFKDRRVVFSRQFSSAVYSLFLSQDQRFLISSPSSGMAVSIDLSALEMKSVLSVKPLLPTAFKTLVKVDFAPNSRFAISKHIGLGLMLWDLQLILPSQGFVEPKSGGSALDYRHAKNTNIAAILTDKNVIEYWDLETRKYLGPALDITGADVIDFNLTANGKWILAILSDGRALRQKVSLGERHPIKVFGE